MAELFNLQKEYLSVILLLSINVQEEFHYD